MVDFTAYRVALKKKMQEGKKKALDKIRLEYLRSKYMEKNNVNLCPARIRRALK